MIVQAQTIELDSVISNKMNAEYPRPDINSEEYHDYYKNIMAA